MPKSILDPDQFECDDLLFIDDISREDLMAWRDYDAEVAYLHPLSESLAAGNITCPHCPEEYTGRADQYLPEEPVFAEFNGPADFEIHAVLFTCPQEHRVLVTLDEPLYEEQPNSHIH